MSNQYDAIIIGAGISGMYQLHTLREQGLLVKVYETGAGVGGAWYWNKYPGCRFDSESYTYGYSWSEEVLQEWDYTERFAAQPDTERYLNFVADKYDFRKDIQFNTRVTKATFDEAANQWEVTLEDGSTARAEILVSASGPLNAHTLPRIPGIDSFKGEWAHTARYPKEGFGGRGNDFSGKRVGVIGTGATGVQVIQEVAKTADSLTVFQLAPEWCAPLGNGPICPEEMKDIKANYKKIFAECNDTFGAFHHKFDERSALDVPDEEREAFFEKKYYEPGFGIWLGNFHDILTDRKANDLITDFIARKIRSRVNDPKTAENLIPKDHGFGTRRVPMETKYFECYNQPNVKLVNLKETPIEEILPAGVKCSDKMYDLDIIIYATGFDAVTGSLKRIDITGKGGAKLTDKWANGPRTLLGMQTVGFPNLFTLVGPHNGATFCNIPRCIEQNVEWVSDTVAYMKQNDFHSIEPTLAAEDAWTIHVDETAEETLFPTADSWFMGVNINDPSKKRTFMLYAGGQQNYRAECDKVAENGYEGFVLK
ncbi:MAG: cyclohexanone monooxygenase [Cellvibrionales bacterium]|nr:MAG: cyclohexanone monooxygenase [Cellvibrionales bacterium]